MKTTKYIAVASIALAAVFAAVSSLAGVVPVDEPGLMLKGRTLADVQANEISGNAIGTHMRPRNMVGLNKVMLPAADGQPTRLRVEMQMMDSYHLKCIVLELTGEFDMVVRDLGTRTCKLFEVKHSMERFDEQFRHLVDARLLSRTEKAFGKIVSRTVLYRGPDFDHDSGVLYRNVEGYLKGLV